VALYFLYSRAHQREGGWGALGGTDAGGGKGRLIFLYSHLLSQTANGVRMQVYIALIASLLISLWVERAPTKRTYEMFCFYFSGWASETELIAHLEQLHLKAPPPCKN
jgi:hypothetical protein